MTHTFNIEEKSKGCDVYAKLHLFQNKQQHCDFTIKCGTKVILVHKCVIAASSDYFNAMLSHNTIENQNNVVELKDVDPESLSKCVDFIYTGKATISKYKMLEMIHAARLLQLQKLCDRIIEHLTTTLDPNSFFTTRKIADIYGLDTLTEACNKFAIDNLYEIMKDEEFRDLEAEGLKSLLMTPSHITVDDIKCKAVMVWVNYDSSRSEKLFEFMQLINISNIRVSYRKFLLNDPNICNSPQCLEYVTNSIPGGSTVHAADFTGLGRLGVLVNDGQTALLLDLKKNVLSELCHLEDGCNNSAVVGDYIYMLSFQHDLNRLHISQKNLIFETLSMPPQVYYGPLASLNGMLYVWYPHKIGQYDIAADQWSEIDHAYVSSFPCMTVAYGKLILIGVRNCDANDISLPESRYCGIRCYDPITLTWSSLDSLPVDIYSASACTHKNIIYVFGSWQQFGDLTHGVHILTSLDGKWETVTLLLPRGIEEYVCHSFNDRIYLVTKMPEPDHDCDKKVYSVYLSVFDPESKSVSELATVPGLSTSMAFCTTMFQFD